MSFIKPETPVSPLGLHRILTPTAAVRVSPLCLGGMNFGEAWKARLGECTKETTFAMLDYFYEQGGNFIDTAVNYQSGESEEWIGEWMEERGVRDEMKEGGKRCKSDYGGNSAKNISNSIERSLKALRTNYTDVYYIHAWDSTISIPELMNALNDLITSHRVLYLGISDTPAWIVVKANCYARQHGLRQFSIYQGRWSAADRSFEREIIPMCLDEGMALAPWGTLGSGKFKTKAQRGNPEHQSARSMPAMGNEEKVSQVLEAIVEKKNPVPAITSVALAYVMHKSPYVFPIVGGRKTSHLESNIEALGLALTEEEIKEIDGAYGFEMGFPDQFLNPGNTAIMGPKDNVYANNMVVIDHMASLRPIAPHT